MEDLVFGFDTIARSARHCLRQASEASDGAIELAEDEDPDGSLAMSAISQNHAMMGILVALIGIHETLGLEMAGA